MSGVATVQIGFARLIARPALAIGTALVLIAADGLAAPLRWTAEGVLLSSAALTLWAAQDLKAALLLLQAAGRIVLGPAALPALSAAKLLLAAILPLGAAGLVDSRVAADAGLLAACLLARRPTALAVGGQAAAVAAGHHQLQLQDQ